MRRFLTFYNVYRVALATTSEYTHGTHISTVCGTHSSIHLHRDNRLRILVLYVPYVYETLSTSSISDSEKNDTFSLLVLVFIFRIYADVCSRIIISGGGLSEPVIYFPVGLTQL